MSPQALAQWKKPLRRPYSDNQRRILEVARRVHDLDEP